MAGSTFKMCAMRKVTLRRAREQANLSREQLALKSGVNARTLYRIEHDEVVPQRSTQRCIAAALSMHPSAIDWPTTTAKEAA